MKQFIVLLCCFLFINITNAQKELTSVTLQTNLLTENQDLMESSQVVKSSIPTYFDWRNEGNTISSIKNYGNCHMPQTYTDIAYYQSLLYIVYKKVYDLSQEYFSQCWNISCRKEGTDQVVWTILSIGYALSSNQTKSCDDFKNFIKLQELHYSQSRTQLSEKDMQVILRRYPVKALIRVTRAFLNYKGGIHTCSQNDTIVFDRYSVQVVGYDNVNRYYIIKTALGKAWGQNGFARISMDQDKSCNIRSYITYLSLAFYPKKGSIPKIHSSQIEQIDCPQQNELNQQNISDSNKTVQENYQARFTILVFMTGLILLMN